MTPLNITVTEPKKNEVIIAYDSPEGRMVVTIPHPPMTHGDLYGAVLAALVGLAIQCGVEPKKTGLSEVDPA